jgi:predicted ATP-grasp superfamily ATP-dependent carboligase
MKTFVLVTDAQPRMTLAVVRSLGQKGVNVLAAEKTRFAPALFSKYCKVGLVNPDPQKYPDEFMQWLIATLDKYPCEMCIPVDDATLDVIMKHRHKLERLTSFVLPPLEGYKVASDKGLSVLAAQQADILCPHTIIPDNLKELDVWIKNLEFPVIIKPRKSSGSRGIKYVEDKEYFKKAYLQVHKEYPFPIVQKYIQPVEKYGVCLLFNSASELRASFVQREVRHYPVNMGTSVVQESVYYPKLVEIGSKLMKSLKWTGIVELDFLVDQQGKAYFMEINPRFWGSLQMAVLAGVDFPWLLYRLAKEGDIEEVHTYKTGILCRWLLPGDILHLLTNKNRLSMNPSFLAGKKDNVYDDILSWDDPLPTLGFIMSCFRYLFDGQMWRFVLKGDHYEKHNNG